MSILAKLSKLRTSADYAAAIADLETEIAAANTRLAELEAGREAALFSKPDSIVGINGEIVTLRTRLDTLAVALKGARDRHAAAVEAEAAAALEREMAEAAKVNAQLRTTYLKLNETAQALADLIQRGRELRAQVQAANAKAREAKRPDLMIIMPISEAAEKLTPRMAVDPLDVIQIREYLPRHPDRPTMAALAG